MDRCIHPDLTILEMYHILNYGEGVVCRRLYKIRCIRMRGLLDIMKDDERECYTVGKDGKVTKAKRVSF